MTDTTLQSLREKYKGLASIMAPYDERNRTAIDSLASSLEASLAQCTTSPQERNKFYTTIITEMVKQIAGLFSQNWFEGSPYTIRDDLWEVATRLVGIVNPFVTQFHPTMQLDPFYRGLMTPFSSDFLEGAEKQFSNLSLA